MMNTNEIKQFASKMHKGQLYGTKPYSYHIKAVATNVVGLFEYDEKVIQVAWLHDVVEDTIVTCNDLLVAGVDPEVVNSVKLLTKDESLDYFENIQRLVNSGNQLAIKVKIADNWANYYEGDRMNKKYMRSMQILYASL